MRLIKRKRKFKSRGPAKAASSRSKPRAAVVGNNGLVGKALPADEVDAERPAPRARSARAARALGGPAPAAPAAASPTKLKNLDPEASARQYLERSFASDRRQSLARPVTDPGASEFRSLGAEAVPLTGTTMVKFRQSVQQDSRVRLAGDGGARQEEPVPRDQLVARHARRRAAHRQDLSREGAGRRGEGLGPAAVPGSRTRRIFTTTSTRTTRRGGSPTSSRTCLSASAKCSRRRPQRRRAEGLRRRRALRPAARGVCRARRRWRR